MSKLSCGIVGLPNVGKSTLFNALTRKAVASSNYPFCTIDPNVGIIDLYDPRLAKLAELSDSKELIYAPVQFTDIAGLVKGAAKGEGLGNKFLANIRECSAIVHVVRCFTDDNIVHVAGQIDPLDDVTTVELELILDDLERATNASEKIKKQAKSAKELAPLVKALEKAIAQLDKNLPLRALSFTKEEEALLRPYSFLTLKKVLYVANVSEKDLPTMENEMVERLRKHVSDFSIVIPICAKLEEEIAQLDFDEQLDFLQSVGLEESGLNRLAKASFSLLGLMTFFTTGEMETRAWTVEKGATAPEAAGKIHSDIQKGFIRAEVISYQDFVVTGGRAKAKELGKMRLEGKEYLVADGDVMNFLHN